MATIQGIHKEDSFRRRGLAKAESPDMRRVDNVAKVLNIFSNAGYSPYVCQTSTIGLENTLSMERF